MNAYDPALVGTLNEITDVMDDINDIRDDIDKKLFPTPEQRDTAVDVMQDMIRQEPGMFPNPGPVLASTSPVELLERFCYPAKLFTQNLTSQAIQEKIVRRLHLASFRLRKTDKDVAENLYRYRATLVGMREPLIVQDTGIRSSTIGNQLFQRPTRTPEQVNIAKKEFVSAIQHHIITEAQTSGRLRELCALIYPNNPDNFSTALFGTPVAGNISIDPVLLPPPAGNLPASSEINTTTFNNPGIKPDYWDTANPWPPLNLTTALGGQRLYGTRDGGGLINGAFKGTKSHAQCMDRAVSFLKDEFQQVSARLAEMRERKTLLKEHFTPEQQKELDQLKEAAQGMQLLYTEVVDPKLTLHNIQEIFRSGKTISVLRERKFKMPYTNSNGKNVVKEIEYLAEEDIDLDDLDRFLDVDQYVSLEGRLGENVQDFIDHVIYDYDTNTMRDQVGNQEVIDTHKKEVIEEDVRNDYAGRPAQVPLRSRLDAENYVNAILKKRTYDKAEGPLPPENERITFSPGSWFFFEGEVEETDPKTKKKKKRKVEIVDSIAHYDEHAQEIVWKNSTKPKRMKVREMILFLMQGKFNNNVAKDINVQFVFNETQRPLNTISDLEGHLGLTRDGANPKADIGIRPGTIIYTGGTGAENQKLVIKKIDEKKKEIRLHDGSTMDFAALVVMKRFKNWMKC